jgi:hypothetical protein
MRYHKTVFCIQLETKKAWAKIFFNFRIFFLNLQNSRFSNGRK